MKKIFLIFAVLAIFSVFVFGSTWIGGGISKELSGLNRTLIEGQLTMGMGMLSFDVGGNLLTSNPNPGYWTQIYTYININAPLQLFEMHSFEIYAGFSPTWFFYNGQFSQSSFTSSGYVHGGVAFNFKPVRIYASVAYIMDYSPFSFGDIPVASVGAQLGF